MRDGLINSFNKDKEIIKSRKKDITLSDFANIKRHRVYRNKKK
jgi:hypothetical protein